MKKAVCFSLPSVPFSGSLDITSRRPWLAAEGGERELLLTMCSVVISTLLGFSYWSFNYSLIPNIIFSMWGIWGSKGLGKFPQVAYKVTGRARGLPPVWLSSRAVLTAPKHLLLLEKSLGFLFLSLPVSFYFYLIISSLSMRPASCDRCCSAHFGSWVSQQREGCALKITQEKKAEGGTSQQEGSRSCLAPGTQQPLMSHRTSFWHFERHKPWDPCTCASPPAQAK